MKARFIIHRPINFQISDSLRDTVLLGHLSEPTHFGLTGSSHLAPPPYSIPVELIKAQEDRQSAYRNIQSLLFWVKLKPYYMALTERVL